MLSPEVFIEFLKNNEYWAYLVLVLSSYFETVIGIGFFIHGEIFFIPAGIFAGLGYLNVWVAYLSLVIGGILGDNTSYYLGIKFGKAIKKALFRKENIYLSEKNFNHGVNFFKKFGEKSLFLSRFLGPVAWITPFLAGTFKLRYKRFFLYNFLGVSVGIANLVLPAYLFGFAYLEFLKSWSIALAWILAVIFIVIILIFYIFRKSLANFKNKVIKHIMEHGIKYLIGWIMIYMVTLIIVFNVFLAK